MQMDKIFQAMVCTDEKKAIYAIYTLVEEIEYSQKGTKALPQVKETLHIWELFKTTFLEKIFPSEYQE